MPNVLLPNISITGIVPVGIDLTSKKFNLSAIKIACQKTEVFKRPGPRNGKNAGTGNRRGKN